MVERPATDDAEPVYALRHLQRFGLGTPFKGIVQDVSRLADRLATEESYPALVVDTTNGLVTAKVCLPRLDFSEWPNRIAEYENVMRWVNSASATKFTVAYRP